MASAFPHLFPRDLYIYTTMSSPTLTRSWSTHKGPLKCWGNDPTERGSLIHYRLIFQNVSLYHGFNFQTRSNVFYDNCTIIILLSIRNHIMPRSVTQLIWQRPHFLTTFNSMELHCVIMFHLNINFCKWTQEKKPLCFYKYASNVLWIDERQRKKSRYLNCLFAIAQSCC